ncbi:MAG: hypothetical protein WDA16_07835 [Candidatus Thermoplasmatota archaeon]
MPKHNVAITLHACPRCGWPNEHEAPKTSPPPEPPAPAPRPRGRPRKAQAGPLAARDFGMSHEEWTSVATDAPATDWYRREICQLEGHTHGPEGELKCILLRLAKTTAEDEGKPKTTQNRDWYRREVCEKEGHTHGEEGELDCAMMRVALLRQRQAKPKVRA